jgi:hypothetical protein
MKILNDFACNWNWIQFNSNSIEDNGMQIDTKDIENHLMVMMLKIIIKRHKYGKTQVPFLFTIRNHINKFQFGIEFIKI